MKEKIKFKYIHGNIYSYYVNIVDINNIIIDKLYLEFEYKFIHDNKLDFCCEYTNNFICNEYGHIIDLNSYYSDLSQIIYKNKLYLILDNLIVGNVKKYKNQIRKTKLKLIC